MTFTLEHANALHLPNIGGESYQIIDDPDEVRARSVLIDELDNASQAPRDKDNFDENESDFPVINSKLPPLDQTKQM